MKDGRTHLAHKAEHGVGIRGDRGRRLQRRRGELVEWPFAHQYETGGLRRVWVGWNLGLLLRRLTGVGTPRSLQGRALSAIYGLIGRPTALWGRLTASRDFQWTPSGLVGSIAHRQAALNRPAPATSLSSTGRVTTPAPAQVTC